MVQAEENMGASEANAAVGGCHDGHGRRGVVQRIFVCFCPHGTCQQPARNFLIQLSQARGSVLKGLRIL